MKSRRLLFPFLIAVLSLSCSVPFFSAPAAPTAPPATLPPAAPPPAAAATDTVAPEATATQGPPMATAGDKPVNCRFGSSSDYEGQGQGLAVGASSPITGKSADGAWWQIQDPSAPAQKCFVSASVVTTSGDTSAVLVVQSPMAFVTQLMLTLKPTSIDAGGGCGGPWKDISFKGTIWTNGPTTVKWFFETEQGGPQSAHSLKFTKYGMQFVTGSYKPSHGPEGSYWVHLVISSPNSMFEEATYKIKC